MALIKTIAEIRSVIPRLSNLSDTANMPNVDKAGRMHIRPIIGKKLYDDLNALAIDAGSDAQKALLKEIKLPLAAVAILDDMAFMHTMITDNGIRTASTEKAPSAHKWEYEKLQFALISYAYDGIELLIDFLYEKKADYADWTNSEEYKEINSFLITTGTDFKKHYPLHQPLRTFWTLKPVMADVEENYLASCIGRELLLWIKNKAEILITAEGGQVDVKKILKKAVAHLTIKHAAEQLAVRFDQNGFTVLLSGDPDSARDSGRGNADPKQLQVKKDAANREGQNYLQKACAYLVGIANGEYGDDFGEDFNTGFSSSPLKKDPNATPYSNGNERRKFFRF